MSLLKGLPKLYISISSRFVFKSVQESNEQSNIVEQIGIQHEV